jgi:hypothetical protein
VERDLPRELKYLEEYDRFVARVQALSPLRDSHMPDAAPKPMCLLPKTPALRFG